MNHIEIIDKGNYQIIKMNRPKVNAINFDLVEELRDAFRLAEADEKVRGVVLTGREGVFSAGLDLIELYDYDREKMEQFFIAFTSLHVELVKFTKPLVCAVTGHSPAGGTVIAIAADYRVMAENPNYSIGLNEVAVNVQITEALIEGYSFLLGRSKAYQHILSGDLLSAPDALKAGLVNEIVPMEQVLERAEKKMKHYLQADPLILKNTKLKLRKYWLQKIDEADHDTDLAQANKVWWSEEVRMKMQFFKQMLQAKKSQ